ncbi:RHS repeat-associated core domain-containing protein [Lysobacter gummosus]|uniref:RHS repeat-associated core domain-containing protein n=1 Tax=Lysobacter gummosus TaxID=262324 RepID=UPI00362E8320
MSNENQTTILARYQYDRLNRLTQTQDGPTGTPLETYAYDATGNRTSVQSGAAGPQAYVYPTDSHRLQSVAGIARTYDATGNTTSIGGTAQQLVYNDLGRLSQFKVDGAANMYYSYNGMGQQVRRTSSTLILHSIYAEDGRWLGEYGDTGVAHQQVIWLDDLPVGVISGIGSAQKLFYIEPDHLGSPRVVIDPSRNVAVWKWGLKGEAFGNTLPNQDPDLDGTKFVFDLRFPGQRYDAASGLNYNYFRDYEAATGRYGQSDPIGLTGGISTFTYVRGNPIIGLDPFGLKDYSECETNEELSYARWSVVYPGSLLHAIINHTIVLDYRLNQPGDTFYVDGRRIGAAEFGNYIAGYAGIYYNGLGGYAGVRIGGLVFDIEDFFAGREFDWDEDSVPDINAGAQRAVDELSWQRPFGCGCSE